MILKIFAIKDTVVGDFESPFYMNNNAVAIRAVTNAVNSSETNSVKENYQDKQLYALGTFDSATGVVNSEVEFVVNLTDLVVKGE